MKMNCFYCADDVNSAYVMDFFEKCAKNKMDVHSLKIVCGGEEKVCAAVYPYNMDDKMQLYSLSKSFASTAIGFLIDDKVLKPSDKIADIFADKIDEKTDKRVKEITLHNVLSMNTGHEKCYLDQLTGEKDIIKAWFEKPIKYKPGTHFCYNNAATYTLSEIVTKYTGLSLFDFLSVRLFLPLEMHGLYWDAYENKKSQGCIGLHASADDLSKFGELYLNGGVYKNKRILSENWVNAAQQPHSDNSDNGSADWTSGYGYQFWRNSRAGYRGDGAFGQLCLIIPEKNMTVALKAVCPDMQQEIDIVFDMLDKLDIKDKKCAKVQETKCAEETVYKLEENLFDITLMYFKQNQDEFLFNFSNGEMWQQIKCKKGEYVNNEFNIAGLTPTLQSYDGKKRVKPVKCAAMLEEKDNKKIIHLRYFDNPHKDSLVFEFFKDNVSISFENRLETALQSEKINAKEII